MPDRKTPILIKRRADYPRHGPPRHQYRRPQYYGDQTESKGLDSIDEIDFRHAMEFGAEQPICFQSIEFYLFVVDVFIELLEESQKVPAHIFIVKETQQYLQAGFINNKSSLKVQKVWQGYKVQPLLDPKHFYSQGQLRLTVYTFFCILQLKI